MFKSNLMFKNIEIQKERRWMAFFEKLLKLIAAIGAINWGLVALFQFNLVEDVCDMASKHMWDKYIYIAVAISGLYLLISIFKD